jgi:hypothetical protein
MFNSKKIAATAATGILGGIALLGLGATQASADDGANACVDDGSNTISCKQTQTCTGGGQVDCKTTVPAGGKELELLKGWSSRA